MENVLTLADSVYDDPQGGGDELLPAVPYLLRDSDGRPYLVGTKCGLCGEILLGTPTVCSCCGGREVMERIVLSETGRLYNFTTVHRSMPGVDVPFVFAVVDLDGGGVINGNLEIDNGQIAFDMPVRMKFRKASKADALGRSYLSYYFVKA